MNLETARIQIGLREFFFFNAFYNLIWSVCVCVCVCSGKSKYFQRPIHAFFSCSIFLFFILFSFLSFIEVQLIYNVSGVQQRDSVIHIHILFQILFCSIFLAEFFNRLIKITNLHRPPTAPAIRYFA